MASKPSSTVGKGGKKGPAPASAGKGGVAAEGVASLKKELNVEQKAKDTIEWSNLELERSVRAMEVMRTYNLIYIFSAPFEHYIEVILKVMQEQVLNSF